MDKPIVSATRTGRTQQSLIESATHCVVDESDHVLAWCQSYYSARESRKTFGGDIKPADPYRERHRAKARRTG